MSLLPKCSDQEFVDGTDRFERRFRKPTAWLLLTLSLIELPVVVWFFLSPYRRFHSSMVDNPVILEHDPVMYDTLKSSYMIGMMMGGMLIFFVLLTLTTFVMSLTMMFGGRRERLLTRCYQELHGSRSTIETAK